MPIIDNSDLRHDLFALTMEDSIIHSPLLASQLAPEIGVDQVSANNPVILAGETMKDGDTRRNPAGGANRSTMVLDSQGYSTEPYFWEHQIDKLTMLTNMQYFNEQIIGTQICKAKLDLGRELRVANGYQDLTAFTAQTGSVVTAAAAWTDASNADPILDLKSMSDLAFAKFGVRKESMEFTIRDTIVDCIFNSDALVRGQYTTNLDTKTRLEMADYLRKFLKVGSVVITDGVYNVSGLGGTASFTNIWDSNFATLAWNDPSAGSTWTFPTFARQPVYTPFTNDKIIHSYEEPANRSLIIAAEEYRGIEFNYKFAILLEDIDV